MWRWLIVLVFVIFAAVPVAAQPTDIAYRNIVDPVTELLPTTEHASREISRFLESSCLYTAPELADDAAVWRKHLALHEGGEPILEAYRPAWESLDLAMRQLQILVDGIPTANRAVLQCSLLGLGGNRADYADAEIVSVVNEMYGRALERVEAASEYLRLARQQANAALAR